MAGLVQNAVTPSKDTTDGAITSVGYSPTSAQAVLANSKDYYAQQAQAAKAASQGYTPTDWTVDKNQTVQGQIKDLTQDVNNPLAVQAQTQAKQEAAKRGLVNSSLAVTAGQEAVLNKALPIAQQDASTYATSGQYNAGSKNTAAQFGAQAANTAELQNAQLATQVSMNNAQLGTSAAAANAAAANQAALQNAQLATGTNQFNAGSANQAGASAAQAANTAYLQKAASDTQLTLADKNATLQQKLAAIQSDTQLSLADKQTASAQIIAAQDTASREKIAQLSSDTQQFLGNLTASTQLATNKLSSDTQLALGTLDAQTKTNLQNIVSQNSQLLQANTSAANVASQYMASIGQVQANDKLDATAKQQAVDNLLAVMQQQLGVVGQIAGLNLSQYFQSAAMPTQAPTAAPTTAPIENVYGG